MTDSSNRSFTTLANPVDPSIALVLRTVDAVARTLGYEYFLAGATARDLVLVNALGLRPGRATRDIDFGLAIQSWSQFSVFTEALTAAGSFRSDATAAQRLYYRHASAGCSEKRRGSERRRIRGCLSLGYPTDRGGRLGG
jgi:predicted nucleotidyltransferase